MNKWKIAFWICLTVLVVITGTSMYLMIDQGTTDTYMKEGYTATENDLDNLIQIINKTDLSKTEIKKEFSKHKFYENMDFKSDTIALDRISLIFKNDKLSKVIKQW